MLNTSTDPPQKSLQIEQDDKFFSRLLSKESTNMPSPSFRVYYGGVSGSVPFLWESQPGTPKHALSKTSLTPPLTPPPSYYSHIGKKPAKKHSKPKLLHTLFFRVNLKKPPERVTSLPASSRSSSHSSSSKGVISQFSSVRPSFDNEEVAVGSPTSTLCFGVGGEISSGGAYLVVIMKKALMAMVGRGSG